VTHQPYDFGQARDAARLASLSQHNAEQALRDAARDFAEKEESYRVALAKEIVRQHEADGVAWTVAPDLARGEKEVAKLRRERDIAEGVREAMQQACWRRAADRKDTQMFCQWSMRRELADVCGGAREPDDMPTYGARRAA
jgi:hypothetical protein